MKTVLRNDKGEITHLRVGSKFLPKEEAEAPKHLKLYYHKTTGGAEYLTDTFITYKDNDGKTHNEGTFTDETNYIVRIDGDITEDAELTIK